MFRGVNWGAETCEAPSEALKQPQSLKPKKQLEYNEEVAAAHQEATYRDLTPHAVEPGQALVTLHGFVALVALGGAVPLHPEMMHYLQSRGGEEGRRERRKHERHTNNKPGRRQKTQMLPRSASFR